MVFLVGLGKLIKRIWKKKTYRWIIGIQIEDTVNNVSVSLPSNAPMPYIVYKGFVYYPYEYNIVIMGFNEKIKFQAIKMK